MEIEDVIPDGAAGLWCHRFGSDGNIGRSYTEVVFTGENPTGAARMMANRCQAFGGITEHDNEALGLADVIDSDGDIVGNFLLTQKGLRYFYKSLGLRVLRNEETTHE